MERKWVYVHLASVAKSLGKARLLILFLRTPAGLHYMFVWSIEATLAWADLHYQDNFDSSGKLKMFPFWF